MAVCCLLLSLWLSSPHSRWSCLFINHFYRVVYVRGVQYITSVIILGHISVLVMLSWIAAQLWFGPNYRTAQQSTNRKKTLQKHGTWGHLSAALRVPHGPPFLRNPHTPQILQNWGRNGKSWRSLFQVLQCSSVVFCSLLCYIEKKEPMMSYHWRWNINISATVSAASDEHMNVYITTCGREFGSIYRI